MRTTLSLSLVLATLALGAAGCWYQPFDPNGHACTTQMDCLDGYRCELSVCVAGEPADAGLDADLDASAPSDAPADARGDAPMPGDAGNDAGRAPIARTGCGCAVPTRSSGQGGWGLLVWLHLRRICNWRRREKS